MSGRYFDHCIVAPLPSPLVLPPSSLPSPSSLPPPSLLPPFSLLPFPSSLLSVAVVTSMLGMPASQVAMGKAHTVVLTQHGTIFTFGSNNCGQCGRNYVPSKEESCELGCGWVGGLGVGRRWRRGAIHFLENRNENLTATKSSS